MNAAIRTKDTVGQVAAPGPLLMTGVDLRRVIVAGAERSPTPACRAAMPDVEPSKPDQQKRVANTRFYFVRGGA